MSEYRTFTGKTVDDAMEEACKHFDAKREKLEVEIIEGGSTGIFGLVGKKKAKIKARLREEIQLVSEQAKQRPVPAAEPAVPDTDAAPAASAPSGPSGETRETRSPGSAASSGEAEPQAPGAPRESRPGNGARQAPAPQDGERRKGGARDARPKDRRPQKERRPENGAAPKRAPQAPRPSQPDAAQTAVPAVSGETPDASAEFPAETAKPQRPPRPRREDGPPAEIPQELKDIVNEVMGRMLEGILGQPAPFTLEGRPDRITVLVDDEDNSGLLIGREGQTLSSLQYLVNRIVARRWESPVRVQINTGEYREKQDENLRRMAIYLADKAKSLGRPQSTKPLSSYHRRVVHLVLQEDDSIQTRSKGEGPLKRVLILPRQQKAESQDSQRS